MAQASLLSPARVVVAYYGATVVFLLLDFLLGVNIRLAFLDQWPLWRALYYAFCLTCFGLMYWRPRWQAVIGVTESLLTMSLLIINMALRVVIVSDEMIESGREPVSAAEIVNFMIASGIVYLGYLQYAGVVAAAAKSSTFNKLR